MPQVGTFITAAGTALSSSNVLLAAGRMVAFMAISQTLSRRMGASRQVIEGMLNSELTPLAERKIVYGEVRVGGSFVYANTTPVYTVLEPVLPPSRGLFRVFEDVNDDLLHFVYEIAGHPCNSLDDIYIDDTPMELQVYNGNDDFSYETRVFPSLKGYPNSLSTDDNGVTRYLPKDGSPYKKYVMVKKYTGSQTKADIDLMDATLQILDTDQRWKSDCIGYGKTYCYVRMGFNPGLFGSFPRISFKVQGKNNIYDPRDTSYKYTDNPALCLADYFTTPKEEGGRGIPWGDLDVPALITAANICDTLVPAYDDGTTEKRYRLSGRVSTGEEPAEVIQDMISAMAGWVEKINGKWVISAGVYTSPSMTLTESEMRARPDVSLNQPMNQVVNEIRPVIRSELTSWEPAPGEGVRGIQQITVTPNPTTDRFTKVAHGIPEGGRVQIRSWDGTVFNDVNIPAGVLAGGFYYAVNVTADDFQISLTDGGSPVNFTSSGSGTIIASYDRFLTEDGERITIDMVMPYVSEPSQARRLARIALLQSRNEVSAKVFCKMGTLYAQPFDLKIGDSVRWIDALKGFWEYTAAAVLASVASSGVVTAAAHGLANDSPLVVTDAGVTGIEVSRPYYVRDADTNTFAIAHYRGGPAIQVSEGDSIEFRTIQGKLFRVVGWDFITEGLAVGVDLDLVATTPDLYTWDNAYEVVPTSNVAITTKKVFEVDTPVNFSVESGTNVLYIRQDGTVGSRARLTWDAQSSSYVTRSGHVEIEYKATNLINFTVDYLTDDDLFNAVGHGLSDGDVVFLRTTGTLPSGLDGTKAYIITDATTDTFKLSIDGSNSYVVMTSNGTGTHSVDEQMTWQSWGDVTGASTEAYVSDLEDGVDYDFRIRFKNSFGANGDWAYVLSHTLVGKTAAPNPVTSLTATTTLKDRIDVSWTPPSDKDLRGIKVEVENTDTSTTFIHYLSPNANGYIDYAPPVTYYNAIPAYLDGSNALQAETDAGTAEIDYTVTTIDTSGNLSTEATATGQVVTPTTFTATDSAQVAEDLVEVYWDNDPSGGPYDVIGVRAVTRDDTLAVVEDITVYVGDVNAPKAQFRFDTSTGAEGVRLAMSWGRKLGNGYIFGPASIINLPLGPS